MPATRRPAGSSEEGVIAVLTIGVVTRIDGSAYWVSLRDTPGFAVGPCESLQPFVQVGHRVIVAPLPHDEYVIVGRAPGVPAPVPVTSVDGRFGNVVLTDLYEPAGATAAHAAAANPHPTYATDADLAAHAAAGDPHPTYATDADLAAHAAAGDPHPGYLTAAEGNAAYEPLGAVANHAAAANPHPTYATDADLAAHAAAADPHAAYATDADLAAHAAAANPHPTYATDADLAGHAAAADPHPGYLTTAEGDAAIAVHAAAANPHPTYATDADLAAHAAAGDPHPGYLTAAEGNAAYEPLGAVANHAAAANPHPTYATDADLAAHAAAADPHAGYATDADLTGHAAAANPHPTYATDADLATHAAAADPHPGYLTPAEVLVVGAVASSSVNGLTNVVTDIPGTSVTFTVATASVAKVDFDMNVVCTTVGTALVIGRIVVDGTAHGTQARGTTRTVQDVTNGQTFTVALAAGSHTLKLAAFKTAADASVVNIVAPHTSWSAIVVPA